MIATQYWHSECTLYISLLLHKNVWRHRSSLFLETVIYVLFINNLESLELSWRTPEAFAPETNTQASQPNISTTIHDSYPTPVQQWNGMSIIMQSNYNPVSLCPIGPVRSKQTARVGLWQVEWGQAVRPKDREVFFRIRILNTNCKKFTPQ